MAPFLHWCFGTRKLESLAISDPKVGILTILQHLMTQECCRLYYAALSLVAGDIGIESRSMYANLRGHSGMLWYGFCYLKIPIILFWFGGFALCANLSSLRT